MKTTVLISQDEVLRRRDMRQEFTFTIDPSNAKDFDDALSFSQTKSGCYEVGVHIADVTHYVREGDDNDKTAYKKGTSIYLVDKVLPMLPEELSNNLCSLRPGEDKLCMSVIFTINKDADIIKHKICRTVICSNFRLNYDEAQIIIEGKENKLIKSDEEKYLSAALFQLNSLAHILRCKRMEAGALDLEQDEIHFTLNEYGHPVDIVFSKPKESNHLIEEFMLLANRTVAEDMSKRTKRMIYRVHDKPDTEKLELIDKFRSHHQQLDSTTMYMLTVRAMAKAVYSTHNIGHYGLAFNHYTHFTSPIRRYPDILVHRLVSEYLLGDRHEKVTIDLQNAAEHCSETEQAAIQEERNSIKQMQALWISDHIGEEFDGFISGVKDFGLFVTLTDSHCDGLVSIRTICHGMYLDYDEKNFLLRASRYRRSKSKKNNDIIYTLGDKVRVKVIRADVEKRQIDFQLVE